MKNNIKLLIASIGFISIIGCGTTDEGQQCADTFFDLLVHEKFDSAAFMLDKLIPIDSVDINNLKQFGNNESFGKLTSAEKKFGFKTNISNGIETVQLPYKLIFENGDFNTNVVLINRGNGFKVASVD